MNVSPRMILFPGLGADPRMYAPQREAIPNLETPAWIAHEPGESLRAYAVRFARTLNVTEPVVLGGVSMGGMIALEVARHVPARCVVLIGSCRGMESLSRVLRVCELGSRVLPDWVLDKGRVFAPIFLGRGPGGGGMSREHRALLVQMARDLPIGFLRWAARAVVEWEGCPGEPRPGVPVLHIHGDSDWVFPLARVKPDRVVPGGIHVLNLSHPQEVNAFILEAAR